eukprot:CAMPEP_0119310392 /NCGR_PEP_ID=MMETSP1333-20130426/19237_1 /TAXON_ID=418940 /ORGANISM="Scyphosphaera apsteinii, Strain RCC1455" /LENGTH=355 /DNA_ID=CAMNT_0007314569 /DNA_START=163 /DNA_END=1230 /DNA_ORIENTATION=+
MATSVGLDSVGPRDPALSSTVWVKFESEVRSAHAAAVARLRQHGGVPSVELVRLLDIEEQTRCQAFQEVLMGETPATMYQSTVRSILSKLLAKLETCSHEPTLYRGAAQCLSEYMSALNHHCDTCTVPSPVGTDYSGLGAIAEADAEALDAFESASIASADSMQSDSTYSSVRSDRVVSADGVSASATMLLQNLHLPGLTVGDLPPTGGTTDTGQAPHVLQHSGSSDEMRKQRRRESNRSASSKYRSKKTATMSTLMSENAALRQQIGTLSSQSAVLTAENKLLKQQVSFLQGILQGQPGTSQPDPALLSASLPAQQHDLTQSNSGGRQDPCFQPVCVQPVDCQLRDVINTQTVK